MFFNTKKKAAGSVLDHWENSKKMEFPEPAEKMDEGGEVEDANHKEACKEIAKDILDAIESKSPGVLASALQSLIEQCRMHEEE